MLITSQEKIKIDVSIGFHSALQMTNMQFMILVIGRAAFMLPIPDDILKQYEAVIEKRAVPLSRHADYIKWLRYYPNLFKR
jgi:hypothetical protein